MNNIVFLMCGKNKLSQKAKVKKIYTSKRFLISIEYAKLLAQEKNVFVLSAKHGLLELETEIEPYDKSIYEMSIVEKQEWAKKVISQLKSKVDLMNNFIFLTDDYYSEYLYEYLANYETPLKGLKQDAHLCWFQNKINERSLNSQ